MASAPRGDMGCIVGDGGTGTIGGDDAIELAPIGDSSDGDGARCGSCGGAPCSPRGESPEGAAGWCGGVSAAAGGECEGDAGPGAKRPRPSMRISTDSSGSFSSACHPAPPRAGQARTPAAAAL